MTAIPQDQKKRILVTGGGTGMGQSVAIAMAENGSRVAISGRRIDKLRETASKSMGSHEILCHEADVTDRKSLETLFEWFDNEIGKIDCLVHAAGINVALRSMQELEPANWDQLIGINLTGTYNVLRCALPRMRAHGKGLVILINSVAGKRSVPLGGKAKGIVMHKHEKMDRYYDADVFAHFFKQRAAYMNASPEEQIAFEGHPATYGMVSDSFAKVI